MMNWRARSLRCGACCTRRGLPPRGNEGSLSSLLGFDEVPEAERLASGRQFMSSENQTFLREQATKGATESHQKEFPEDFVYDFVEPGPGDNFEFGIDYKACGFYKFTARHGDKEILPNICGLDFDAYATRGIRLERTQTLAGGASRCNFRFSRLP